MKTKEYNEAVEKLGKALLDRIYQGDLPITYSDAHKVFSELAKAAIDVLGIEIVSADSEFEIGDSIYNRDNVNFSAVVDNYVLDNSENYMNYRTTRRNNKPAVYVENIGKNEIR